MRPDPRGRWVAVVGARPNYVKLAPLVAAAARVGRDLLWIDTGQHADVRMSRALWTDLGLPPPAVRLRAPPPGPRRAERMAARVVPRLARLAPSRVVVVGDTDSTVAGALAARALGVPLAHVEAGVRSGERGLPEEHNRRLVDRWSALLHVPERSGVLHLRRERVRGRVHESGNVMADALAAAQPLPASPWRSPYVLATLHRQANVDDPGRLERLRDALVQVAEDLPVVFPVHPRTRRRLRALRAARRRAPGLVLAEPMGHREFLGVLRGAALVVTDSGGVQVEASILGVPCVTARARTEHTITLTHGTNRLAGGDARRLAGVVRRTLDLPVPRRPLPWEWDGHAADRVIAEWTAAAW